MRDPAPRSAMLQCWPPCSSLRLWTACPASLEMGYRVLRKSVRREEKGPRIAPRPLVSMELKVQDPAAATFAETLVNTELKRLPTAVTAVMMTTAIKATIRPYSTAVAASSPR